MKKDPLGTADWPVKDNDEEIVAEELIRPSAGGDRAVTVSHCESGAVVLSVEDNHSVAIVELTRKEADAVIRAMLSKELAS